MTIDLETVRYYAGLGDLVMWGWLAEGARRGGFPLTVHRKRDLELAALVGLDVTPEPGGLSPDPVYDRELADRGRRSRVEYLREFLGLPFPPARPRLRVPTDAAAWAAGKARELGGPLVLVFPQTAWRAREWPPNYWVDLAWGLKAAGCVPVVLLANEDARYKNTPLYWWGFPVFKLAALMTHAALVVGNDSFPAHLGGAVGAPTLAVLGPTRPTVFGYSPDVECLGTDVLECSGCHFGVPFRAACDQGCQSLYRLPPDVVLRRAVAKARAHALVGLPL